MRHLCAGLCVGGAGMCSGYALGSIGERGIKTFVQESKFFVGLVMLLIFAEVLTLYGLVTALMLVSSQEKC